MIKVFFQKHFKLILILFLSLAIVIISIILYLIYLHNHSLSLNNKTSYSGITYKIDPKYKFKINVLAYNINQVTRIKITPDGNLMFVSTLKGEIFVFKKDESMGGMFVRQDSPFYTVDTKLEGFPRENGLTGFAFASDFEKTKEIFLTYTTLNDNNQIKNRIGRITLNDDGMNISGKDFRVIFEGNVAPSQAHQIQDGVGVSINGKSHFMFTIGDAFVSSNAHDISKDAGKLMLIQRDGKDPIGTRPYPNNPKVQAIGIRNSYDIKVNPYDLEKRYLLGDTGDSKNDKLIYGKMISLNGNNSKQIDLKWNGEDISQTLDIPDLYSSKNPQPNMNLYQWPVTITPLDIEFIKGGVGNIGTSNQNESYFLITLFGKTGSKDNTPGKEIMIGKLTNLESQPKVELLPFISRNSYGQGLQGQPIGMAVDPTTQNIYFADLFEGKIYEVSEGENNSNNIDSNSSQSNDVSDMTSMQNIDLKIQNFGFTPQKIRIKKGTTITWTNTDLIHHTVTSNNGKELDSEFLNQNDTYKHTFNSLGTFNYHCAPHPFMTGTIEVVQ